MAHRVASTASHEPIGFAEGAPMLIQGPTGIVSAHARLPVCTHSYSTANRASIMASTGGLVRLGPPPSAAPRSLASRRAGRLWTGAI